MKVVYFSHVGNTHKFVQERLLPALKANPFNWDDGKGYEAPTCERLHATGPQRPTEEDLKDDTDERVVIVFPIYARGDYETGEVKDTVPAVVKQYIAANRDKIFAALVSGNRTFGAKYAYVDPKELDGIPLVYAFELSGTKMDAMTARELLHLESKAAKKEEVTNE